MQNSHAPLPARASVPAPAPAAAARIPAAPAGAARGPVRRLADRLASILGPALLAAALAAAAPAGAEDGIAPDEIILPGHEVSLEDFLWRKRPLVVFADSAADPRYVKQMNEITERLEALAERDVVVLVDTDPGQRSALRRKLHPRGFMLVLIGKDGNVYLRKPNPWSVREISRSIDKMPLRQQEIRDRLTDS
ncbi:MAG: hypothetical protein Kow0058_16380 [Roseovarius sp.]